MMGLQFRVKSEQGGGNVRHSHNKVEQNGNIENCLTEDTVVGGKSAMHAGGRV